MPVSVPTFIKQAWAAVGTKFTIPDNANPTTGRAGWDQGFSPINLTPVAAGGIPPFGQDMNGVLYDITSAIQYIQAGRSFPYNQDFANAIGGYGNGSLVSLESDLSVVYKSKIDNNLLPPPSANWDIVGNFQATESVAGVAKIATQAKVNAGTDDLDFVTSKKMRSGFSISTSVNGFVAFPTWLGGLILQWGTATVPTGPTVGVFNLPTAFPNKSFVGIAVDSGVASNAFALNVSSVTKTQISINASPSAEPVEVSFFVIGH